MQNNSSNKIDLLADPIPATLKTMTVPMLIGMVMLMLFNLVDTFFVSLLGTDPLAAISFTFPVTFTVISLAIGLSIGTSAVIAKALGSGDLAQARFDGVVALIVSACFVAVLAFLGYLSIDYIFSLLGASETLMPYIHDYMAVWFIGSVILITPMIGNAVLRASGDTKTPSIIMGFAGLVNAILDPMLIFGFGPIPAMGIKGAAVASVIAWSSAVVLIMYILIYQKKLLSLDAGQQTFMRAARKILKIGVPAASANMLTPIAMAVMTAMIAKHGDTAVAAFGVGSRIESIACLVVLALSMTLPPFISQNFGAGKIARVEEAYKTALKFILGWQLGIYLVLVASSYWLSRAFASDPHVIEVIQLFMWIMPLGYGIQGIIILSNSSFNALHLPMNALLLSIVRLFIFYLPFAYVGNAIAGLEGLFIGAVLGNVFTAAIAYYWFTHSLVKVHKQNNKQECTV